MHPLTVPEAKSQNQGVGRAALPSKTLRENPLLLLPSSDSSWPPGLKAASPHPLSRSVNVLLPHICVQVPSFYLPGHKSLDLGHTLSSEGFHPKSLNKLHL